MRAESSLKGKRHRRAALLNVKHQLYNVIRNMSKSHAEKEKISKIAISSNRQREKYF